VIGRANQRENQAKLSIFAVHRMVLAAIGHDDHRQGVGSVKKRTATKKGAAKTMLPRERCDYSAIVDRPPLKLPGGARIVF
jgi:hypothetical protein